MDNRGPVAADRQRRHHGHDEDPATWEMLLAAGGVPPKVHLRLCGGEALPGHLAAALATGGAELWNVYGPTETTVWSSAALVG